VPRPLITAIIPAYNVADTIGRAIASVLAQTYHNIEVVLVNDGSTDDTARIVQESYPEVVYIEQENSGPSVARNRAAEAASGEFLACLDADDAWVPEKTERQLQVMLDDPGVSAVATSGWVLRDGHRYPWGNPRKPRVRDITVRDLLQGLLPICPSLMIRADAFGALGGYDPVGAENLDLFCRLLAMGQRFVYLNEMLYLYHSQPGSRSSASFADHTEETLHVLAKFDPRRADLPWTSPLSEAEYSWFVGNRLVQGAMVSIRQGRRAKASNYLARLDELPAPAPLHRLEHWLWRHAWPLFIMVAAVHRGYLRGRRAYRIWGIMGGLEQLWRKYLRPTPVASTTEEGHALPGAEDSR